MILNSLGIIISLELREHWISSHLVPTSWEVTMSPGTWDGSREIKAAAESGGNMRSQREWYRVWEMLRVCKYPLSWVPLPLLHSIAWEIWCLIRSICSQKLACPSVSFHNEPGLAEGQILYLMLFLLLESPFYFFFFKPDQLLRIRWDSYGTTPPGLSRCSSSSVLPWQLELTCIT